MPPMGVKAIRVEGGRLRRGDRGHRVEGGSSISSTISSSISSSATRRWENGSNKKRKKKKEKRARGNIVPLALPLLGRGKKRWRRRWWRWRRKRGACTSREMVTRRVGCWGQKVGISFGGVERRAGVDVPRLLAQLGTLAHDGDRSRRCGIVV